MRFLIRTVLCLSCVGQLSQSSAQNSTLDSLYTALASSQTQYQKLECLNALAYQLSYLDADSAMTTAQAALILAERLNQEKAKADAHNNLGVASHIRGNFVQALAHYQSSLQLRISLADSAGIAGLQNNIASIYAVQGNYPLALENYQASLNMKLQLGNGRGAANSLNNIGNIYYYQKNFSQALKYYQEALSLENDLQNAMGQGRSLGNIGLVLLDQGNFSEAITYYKRAYQIMDSLNLECQTMYPANGLGASLFASGEIEAARGYLMEALEDGKACNDPVIISSSLETLANVELSSNHPSKAEQFLLESFDVAQKNNLKVSIKDVSWSLYNFYKGRDTQKALAFLEINRALTDSIFNDDLTAQLTRLELNYQFQQEKDSIQYAREREVYSFNAALRQRQVILIFTSVVLGLAIILLFIIYRFYQLKKKANEQLFDKNALITKSLREKELMLNEIHHRVKNNLQIVSSLLSIQSRLVRDEGAKKAIRDSQNRILSMAMVHQNLYSRGEVAEIDMAHYLNQLIKSIAHTFDENANHELQIFISPIQLPPDIAVNIGLIANELLTNVYKHAFPSGTKNALVKISLGIEGKDLIFAVEDNGIGITSHTESYGSYLMQTLANSMNGSLTFRSEIGTCFILRIPDPNGL